MIVFVELICYLFDFLVRHVVDDVGFICMAF